jgi:hypothetical protein
LIELPYLSVVATARNDDHGGNPLYRTQLFVDGLVEQADRFRCPTELVLVEWNPPSDRPGLAEVLDWRRGEGWCSVRIVQVPSELHSTHDHAERLPLFQMIAKNVGVRRARGEFVVATNIDILLSDELMGFIASRQLRHGFLYRADRYDVPAEIDRAWPIAEQLAFCERAAIRVNRRDGTLDLRTGDFYRIYPDSSPLAWLRNSPSGKRVLSSPLLQKAGLARLAYARPLPHAGVVGRAHDALTQNRHAIADARRLRLQLAEASQETRVLAWRTYAFAYWIVAGFNQPKLVPQRMRRLLNATAANPAAASSDAAQTPLTSGPARRRATSDRLDALAQLAKRRWAATERDGVSRSEQAMRVRLHTNASGDFTLMSKDDWLAVGGYAEFEMYSMHIDGLLLYDAYYSGIRERFLPFPVYHIEHGGGFRPEAKGDEALDATLAQREIPQISNEQLMEYIRTMFRSRAPLRPNREGWGLASIELAEIRPQGEPLVGSAATRGNE